MKSLTLLFVAVSAVKINKWGPDEDISPSAIWGNASEAAESETYKLDQDPGYEVKLQLNSNLYEKKWGPDEDISPEAIWGNAVEGS